MDNRENTQSETAILQVHFFYVVLILVGVIILLATQRWTGIEKFTDYLTSAGTMVSIVLGVLAIIYSFVSGDSISKSLGSVAAAATDLQAAREEFSTVVDEASHLAVTSRVTAEELSDLVEVLKSEMQDVKKTSADLSESNAGIIKTLGLMPERLDKIDNRLAESLMSTQKKSTSEHPPTNAALARKMLLHSSIFGIGVLYANAMSAETGHTFSFAAVPFDDSSEYCYGFLLAAHAAGVLDFDDVDKKTRTFQTKDFPLSLSEVDALLADFLKTDRAKKGQLPKILAQVRQMIYGGDGSEEVPQLEET